MFTFITVYISLEVYQLHTPLYSHVTPCQKEYLEVTGGSPRMVGQFIPQLLINTTLRGEHKIH